MVIGLALWRNWRYTPLWGLTQLYYSNVEPLHQQVFAWVVNILPSIGRLGENFPLAVCLLFHFKCRNFRNAWEHRWVLVDLIKSRLWQVIDIIGVFSWQNMFKVSCLDIFRILLFLEDFEVFLDLKASLVLVLDNVILFALKSDIINWVNPLPVVDE